VKIHKKLERQKKTVSVRVDRKHLDDLYRSISTVVLCEVHYMPIHIASDWQPVKQSSR